MKVFMGPNFTPGSRLRLYAEPNHTGNYIDLVPGEYPDLGASHAFGDLARSSQLIVDP